MDDSKISVQGTAVRLPGQDMDNINGIILDFGIIYQKEYNHGPLCCQTPERTEEGKTRLYLKISHKQKIGFFHLSPEEPARQFLYQRLSQR